MYDVKRMNSLSVTMSVSRVVTGEAQVQRNRMDSSFEWNKNTLFTEKKDLDTLVVGELARGKKHTTIWKGKGKDWDNI